MLAYMGNDIYLTLKARKAVAYRERIDKARDLI